MGLFGISVLLVEDENSVANVLQMVLRDAQPPGWAISYNIKHVETLQLAQQYVSGGGWDVILLDLELPDSKGIDTFRACYGIAKAPIIVLSGSVDMETMQKMIREGAYRCFEKTMIIKSLTWLHYAILACVETYRLRAQVERLQETLLNELRNLITACSNCHRWRNSASNEYMESDKMLEKYGVFLSHGICPECSKLLYGDLVDNGDNPSRQT